MIWNLVYLNIHESRLVTTENLRYWGRGKVVVAREGSIKNVLVVESLGYNLLSIYQLSKCGYGCYFDDESVIITVKGPLKVVFVGHVEFGMYVLYFLMKAPLPQPA